MMVQCGLLLHALNNTRQSHDGLEFSLPKDFSFVQEHDSTFGAQYEPLGRWYQSRSNVCRKQNFHSQTGSQPELEWPDRKWDKEHMIRQRARQRTQGQTGNQEDHTIRLKARRAHVLQELRDHMVRQEVRQRCFDCTESQRSNGIEVNTQVLEDRACKAQESVRQRMYGQTGSQAELLRPRETQTKLRQEIRQNRRKPMTTIPTFHLFGGIISHIMISLQPNQVFDTQLLGDKEELYLNHSFQIHPNSVTLINSDTPKILSTCVTVT